MFLTHAYFVLWSFERLDTTTKFSDWTLTLGNYSGWGSGYSVFGKWPARYNTGVAYVTPNPFDCTDVQHSYGIYSPDKVEEYVTNPQPKTSPPYSSEYKWEYQSDPQQVLKDAIGSDFLYQWPFRGIKYADNFRQRLETLNALRHISKLFDVSVNVKKHRRVRTYDSSGFPESDTGWIVTDLADGLGMSQTSYYSKYQNDNVIESRVEQYFTYDIDMSRLETAYDINPNLISVMRAYLREQHTIDGSEYDGSVTTIQDGMSISNQVSAPDTIPDTTGTYIRDKKFYRFATSLKETMEDLANAYQVPY